MFARPLTRAVDDDVPVRHGYLLVSLLTFLVAVLIKPASIICDFLTQMANEFSMVMAPVKPAILCAFPGPSAWDRDRPGWLPPPPANWCVRSRLAFVVFGVSFKPELLWVTWWCCVTPWLAAEKPRDVKPVASACLDQIQTPITLMITNLKQQKNRERH